MNEFVNTECCVVLPVLDPGPGHEARLQHQVGGEDPLVEAGPGAGERGGGDPQVEEEDQPVGSHLTARTGA